MVILCSTLLLPLDMGIFDPRTCSVTTGRRKKEKKGGAGRRETGQSHVTAFLLDNTHNKYILRIPFGNNNNNNKRALSQSRVSLLKTCWPGILVLFYILQTSTYLSSNGFLWGPACHVASGRRRSGTFLMPLGLLDLKPSSPCPSFFFPFLFYLIIVSFPQGSRSGASFKTSRVETWGRPCARAARHPAHPSVVEHSNVAYLAYIRVSLLSLFLYCCTYLYKVLLAGTFFLLFISTPPSNRHHCCSHGSLCSSYQRWRSNPLSISSQSNHTFLRQEGRTLLFT